MSAKTGIEWTDATWNCVVGCDLVSPGCAHCYAKELHDKRHAAHLNGKAVAPQYAHPFETVQLLPDRLMVPLRRRTPTRYFVNSVSDLFHDDVPDEFIDRVFAVMRLTPWHTYQILTKRPARMLAYMTERFQPTVHQRGEQGRESRVHEAGEAMVYGEYIDFFGAARFWTSEGSSIGMAQPWPLPNVWLGVSVENQRWADERIPILLKTPAAIRFLSCEPLLGPVDLSPWLDEWPLPTLDWIIVGGESGTEARAMALDWIEDIVACSVFNGVSPFVKQMGRWIIGDHEGFDVNRWLMDDGRVFFPPVLGAHAYDRPKGAVAFGLGDTKGGEMLHWPERLRIREFPKSAVRT